MYRIRYIKLITLCMFSCLTLGIIGIVAQETTETPLINDIERESIFTNDTCTPPCWFGLIPGESTSQEVLDFLLSSTQVANVTISQNRETIYVVEDTELLINGGYSFDFGPFENIPNCCLLSSGVNISEGILAKIRISLREYITFEEVINQMNMPDEIRLSRFAGFTGTSHADFTITLIYYDSYVIITLFTISDFENPIMCHFSGINDYFHVGSAIYLSHQRATELVDIPLAEPGLQLPALIVYQPEERHVPQEMRDSMMGDDPIACQDLWNNLPQERILPESWNEEETESE